MAQLLSSYRLPVLCEALQGSRSGFYHWKSVNLRFVLSIRPSATRSLS